MICHKNPQLLFHIPICPKPKVKLGPTETFYPAPPSLVDIATARNPSLFGPLIGISVSPRWDCNLSVSLRNVPVKPRWAIGPTEIAMLTLCFPFVTFRANRSHRVCLTNYPFVYYQNRSHRVCVIGLTEITLCPNPKKMVPRSHRKSLRSHFELNRSDRVSWFGPTEFGDLCVTVRFVWRLFIPLHPLFIYGEIHQNMPTLSTYIFWERTTYTCVEVKIFHSNHINLDL